MKRLWMQILNRRADKHIMRGNMNIEIPALLKVSIVKISEY